MTCCRRVSRSAFGRGQPKRDLLLSPDHGVWCDGVLIPGRYLLNGVTVTQETVEAVTYWHVELAEHGVLLAEGLPCESYLDTGNRSAFADCGPSTRLHPDLARQVWDAEACAELVLEGPPGAARTHALLARAPEAPHVST